MLEPADIRIHWDWIRPALEKIKAMRGGDWIPENIFADCVNERAYLWIDPENDPGGFIVFKPELNQLNGKKELLVWIAYSESGRSQRQHNQEIEDIARQEGFDLIKFYRMPKRVEERKPQALGWRKSYTVYERDVTP